MIGTDDRSDTKALLEWYVASGVDETIGEIPVDRFAATARAASDKPLQHDALNPAAHQPAPAKPAAGAATEPRSDPVSDATKLAAEAQTLEDLERKVGTFEGCTLKTTAKNTCFADGSPAGGIMFIGEGPGRDEDLSGTPFVGRAGQLLDKMLAAIALDRSSAYITNCVFWRPPGNRNPTAAETAACRPFTDRQILLARPDILVFLGGVAAKTMLETNEGIMRLRGKWREYTPHGGPPFKAIATFHPAYLLRQPEQKRQAWRDLVEIRKALNQRSKRD